MRIFTEANVSHAPSIESSAMAYGRHGRICDFEGGCNSFGCDRGSYGGRQSDFDNEPTQCKHCVRSNYISE